MELDRLDIMCQFWVVQNGVEEQPEIELAEQLDISVQEPLDYVQIKVFGREAQGHQVVFVQVEQNLAD